MEGRLIIVFVLVFSQIFSQESLLLNGGFGVTCPQSNLRIEGQLMDTKSGENFFLTGDIFTSGNLKSLYWSCQSEYDHGSHFWFEKDSLNEIKIFAKIKSHFHFLLGDQIREDSIIGTLRRKLRPNENITLSIWSNSYSRSQLEISGDVLLAFLSSTGKTLYREIISPYNAQFPNNRSSLNYIASGDEKFLVIKSDISIHNPKTFKKAIKRLKKKGRLKYDLYETVIDSIAVIGESTVANISHVNVGDNIEHTTDLTTEHSSIVFTESTSEKDLPLQITSKIMPQSDTIQFISLYFKSNQSHLNLDQLAFLHSELDAYVDGLNRDPKSILVNGYTDNTGTMNQNEVLAQERADFISNILKTKFSDILIKSRGNGVCIRQNDMQARRVDILLILQ